MTPNELRIGNNVIYKGEIVHIMTISGIKYAFNKIDVTVNPISGWKTVDITEISPIPLTKEWLIKFGFKPFCKDWQLWGIIVHTRKRGFIINKTTIQMEYVHQLQNYVFAKTRKELCLSQKNH